MAIYEFECLACGQRFEVTRPMSQHDHLKQNAPVCPKCGKTDRHGVAPLVGYQAPSAG